MRTVVLVLVAGLLAPVVVAFLLRPRFLLSGLGAVTMWLRPEGSTRWSVGVAWYGGDTLLWYRALSLSVRPQRRVCRAALRIDGQRRREQGDLPLPPEVVVLSCTPDTGPAELAMDPSTVTG